MNPETPKTQSENEVLELPEPPSNPKRYFCSNLLFCLSEIIYQVIGATAKRGHPRKAVVATDEKTVNATAKRGRPRKAVVATDEKN